MHVTAGKKLASDQTSEEPVTIIQATFCTDDFPALQTSKEKVLLYANLHLVVNIILNLYKHYRSQYRSVVDYPIPSEGEGMAEDHGAPGARKDGARVGMNVTSH